MKSLDRVLTVKFKASDISSFWPQTISNQALWRLSKEEPVLNKYRAKMTMDGPHPEEDQRCQCEGVACLTALWGSGAVDFIFPLSNLRSESSTT